MQAPSPRPGRDAEPVVPEGQPVVHEGQPDHGRPAVYGEPSRGGGGDDRMAFLVRRAEEVSAGWRAR